MRHLRPRLIGYAWIWLEMSFLWSSLAELLSIPIEVNVFFIILFRYNNGLIYDLIMSIYVCIFRNVVDAYFVGAVSVVSTAREDWVPYVDSSRRVEGEEEEQRVLVRTKARWDEEDGDGNVLDFRQPSQADWIRQYVEQQEEVCIRRAFFCCLLYFYMHLFCSWKQGKWWGILVLSWVLPT